MRDYTESAEKKFDDQSSDRHGAVKNCNNECSYFPAVMLSVDVDDPKNNQVGINQGDHAAEADPTVPKHRRQRNIADGANKGEDRNQWSDNWPPQRRGDWMRCEEKCFPEIRRHPRGERAS